MSNPLIQIGNEVREMTDEEFTEYQLRAATVNQPVVEEAPTEPIVEETENV